MCLIVNHFRPARKGLADTAGLPRASNESYFECRMHDPFSTSRLRP